MIPFDEVQFPTEMSYGFTAEFDFSNTLIENSGGYETRICRWYYPIHTFNVIESIKTRDHIAAISAFYVARQGPSRGFRFQDWTDYTSAADGISAPTSGDQTMLPTTTPTVWQLAKQYTSGVISKNRNIFKPQNGTVTVAVAGTTLTLGTDFTVDYTAEKILSFNNR